MESDDRRDGEGRNGSSLLARFESAVRERGRDPLSALAEVLASGGGPDPGVVQLQGTVLDGHRLTALVGVGGMGATYRATSPAGEEVAVKVVGGLSADRRDRFESECAFLQQLRHPGIVRYRDHGFLDGGRAWLVMDFVAGRNLESVLDDLDREQAGPVTGDLLAGLPVGPKERLASEEWRRRVAAFAAKVAGALAEAHATGIVHRDLKPGNIMLKPDLDPVLIDFGLSRDLFRAVSLTHSHVLIGTLACMAPEQLAGKPGDPRTDIFALGLILFRLLTGRDLRPDVSDVVRYGRRPLIFERQGAAGLPPAFRGVLYGCLDPRPERRYPTMKALLSDLESLIAGRPVSRRPPSALRRGLRTRGGRWALAALIAALAVAAFLALRPAEPYLITIDCLTDGGVMIDGIEPKHSTPYTRIPIRPGRHSLRFLGDQEVWPIEEEEFVVNRHLSRLVLLTVSTAQGTGLQISHRIHESDDAALLRVVSGDPEARLVIDDGWGVPRDARWIQVRPGSHRVTAFGQDGQFETQEVSLKRRQINEVHLLSADLRGVKGSFRRTLGCAFSPLPPEISLVLQDGVSLFLNGMEDEDLQSPDHVCRRSCVTLEGLDEERQAVIRVVFPKPMRSLAFHQMSSVKEPALMDLDYRVERGNWIPMLVDTHLVTPSVTSVGVSWLEVRARMSCELVPVGWGFAEFLWGYFDVPAGEKRSACFAVVADPDPPR